MLLVLKFKKKRGENQTFRSMSTDLISAKLTLFNTCGVSLPTYLFKPDFKKEEFLIRPFFYVSCVASFLNLREKVVKLVIGNHTKMKFGSIVFI